MPIHDAFLSHHHPIHHFSLHFSCDPTNLKTPSQYEYIRLDICNKHILYAHTELAAENRWSLPGAGTDRRGACMAYLLMAAATHQHGVCHH